MVATGLEIPIATTAVRLIVAVSSSSRNLKKAEKILSDETLTKNIEFLFSKDPILARKTDDIRIRLQWKTAEAERKIFLFRFYHAYKVRNSAEQYRVFVDRSTSQTRLKIAREKSERPQRQTEDRSNGRETPQERRTEHRPASNGRGQEPNRAPVAVIETSSSITTLYGGTTENPMVIAVNGAQLPESVIPGTFLLINAGSSSASTPPDHIRVPVVKTLHRHHNESGEGHSTSKDLQTEILRDFKDALDIADTISSLDLDAETNSFVTDGVNFAPYPDDDSDVDDSDYHSVMSSPDVVITMGTSEGH